MSDMCDSRPHYHSSLRQQQCATDTKKNLEKAEEVKIQKYRDAATDWRARVQPLQYTTFGATSRYTEKWLTDVGAAAKNNAQHFPELDGKLKVVWRENISFSIMFTTKLTFLLVKINLTSKR
jgi:hypothetical protein